MLYVTYHVYAVSVDPLLLLTLAPPDPGKPGAPAGPTGPFRERRERRHSQICPQIAIRDSTINTKLKATIRDLSLSLSFSSLVAYLMWIEERVGTHRGASRTGQTIITTSTLQETEGCVTMGSAVPKTAQHCTAVSQSGTIIQHC